MSDLELRDKVREWLDKQGYPHELTVGRVFEKHGWYADHQVWYTDQSTGATREIDLVVTKWLIGGPERTKVAFSLVVECKRSLAKPWVVLSSPIPNMLFLRHPFPKWLSYDADLVARVDGRATPPAALLPPKNRIGHAVVAAFTDPKDGAPMSPYSALRSVVGATHAKDHEDADVSLAGSDSITVYAPLVVVDGRLFECFLNDDTASEPIVEETAHACVILPDDPPGRLEVAVVPMANLLEFVAALTPQVEAYIEALLPHTATVIEAHRQRRQTLAERWAEALREAHP